LALRQESSELSVKVALGNGTIEKLGEHRHVLIHLDTKLDKRRWERSEQEKERGGGKGGEGDHPRVSPYNIVGHLRST